MPFDWAREAARHVGTVAHRLFAQIAREGLAAWDAARVAALQRADPRRARGEGVDDAELDGAVADVVASAVRDCSPTSGGAGCSTPGTPTREANGRWPASRSGAIVRIVIDRTFVADGVRWIVDFKTGAHEGGDVDAFLDREVERYRGQLERYARFVRALDARPIRLGLYFPLQGGWREWDGAKRRCCRLRQWRRKTGEGSPKIR